MMRLVIFGLLALVAIGGALRVVTSRKPVSSALYLVLVMCAIAGLFALMGAIFLAAMQIIVYAGAIMVLFLFVIMLLNLRRDEFGHDPYRFQKYLGVAFAAIMLIQGVLIVNMAMKNMTTADVTSGVQNVQANSVDPPDPVDYNSAPVVAEILFTKFAYPFEVTSILLLAAIIGAVVVARKRRPDEPGKEERI